MIHRHRALGDRIQWIAGQIALFAFQRRIPEWQRIEIFGDTLAQMVGRLFAGTLALCGETEALQDLRIDMDHDGIVVAAQACLLRPFHIAPVPVAHVLVRVRHVILEKTIILFVHFPLLGVRFSAQGFLATLAAPACQKTDTRAWSGFIIHHEIRIILVFARTLGGGKGRKFETACQLDQYLLKRLALAFWRQHRNAHRIHRPIEFRDRPVQHGHAIVALQIGCVGQDQVGERGSLRLERIAHHDERDLVAAVGILVGEHVAHFRSIHAGVPRHVGHEQQQGIDRIRVAAPGIGDHVVHQPVR